MVKTGNYFKVIITDVKHLSGLDFQETITAAAYFFFTHKPNVSASPA